jgi:hypothetical protein
MLQFAVERARVVFPKAVPMRARSFAPLVKSAGLQDDAIDKGEENLPC